MFAAAALSGTVGLSFLARNFIAQGNYAPALMLTPFALAGLGMLIYAINGTRGWWRFGQVTLALDPYPGSIGGNVGGHADVRLPYDALNHFQVFLMCQRVVTTGGHGKSDQRIDVAWSAQGLAQAEARPGGTRLSFRFDVPGDLPPSATRSSDYHRWRVMLAARLPGADLERSFDIPVFPTAEPSREIHLDSTKHPDLGDFHRTEALSIVKLSRDSDGGTVLKYPMFHFEKVKGGSILLAVGLGCALPGLAMLLDEVNVVGIALLCVGLLFAPGGFYLLFHHLTVKLNTVRLEATLKILGVPVRRRVAARGDVEHLSSDGQFLRATVRNGKAITISQSFADQGAATQALKAIVSSTGYPTKRPKRRRKQS